MHMNLSGWMILHHGPCPVHYRMLNSIFFVTNVSTQLCFSLGSKISLGSVNEVGPSRNTGGHLSFFHRDFIDGELDIEALFS